MERAAAAGRPIVVRALVTAMRQAARSMEIAELAIRWRDAGVVLGNHTFSHPSLHKTPLARSCRPVRRRG